MRNEPHRIGFKRIVIDLPVPGFALHRVVEYTPNPFIKRNICRDSAQVKTSSGSGRGVEADEAVAVINNWLAGGWLETRRDPVEPAPALFD